MLLCGSRGLPELRKWVVRKFCGYPGLSCSILKSTVIGWQFENRPLVCFQVIASLQDEEDINQITEYFSYEHFYVIYCKFWELDKDHDLFISKEDLARHNDHGT